MLPTVTLRSLGVVVPLIAALAWTPSAAAQGLVEALSAETSRGRERLETLASSPLVDGERPRLKGLFDDADSFIKVGRLHVAIETLASAVPGLIAVSRAATGWDDTGKASGKHIEALTKEWEDVGRAIKVDRSKFPAAPPQGQSAFVRAMAEQSLGQVDEHYAVAVDYARFSGVSSGAYYLGRAEGQMAWALTLSRLSTQSTKAIIAIPTLTTPLARLEDEIVSAYAKPGSTVQHSNFILANSSLKLAKELDRHGLQQGSLVTLLRSLFSLSLATMTVPAPEEIKALEAEAGQFESRFAGATQDQSIGEAFVEKARVAIEKSQAGGEGADRERLRAAGLLRMVVPRYIEIMEGLQK